MCTEGYDYSRDSSSPIGYWRHDSQSKDAQLHASSGTRNRNEHLQKDDEQLPIFPP